MESPTVRSTAAANCVSKWLIEDLAPHICTCWKISTRKRTVCSVTIPLSHTPYERARVKGANEASSLLVHNNTPFGSIFDTLGTPYFSIDFYFTSFDYIRKDHLAPNLNEKVGFITRTAQTLPVVWVFKAHAHGTNFDPSAKISNLKRWPKNRSFLFTLLPCTIHCTKHAQMHRRQLGGLKTTRA